MAHLELIVLIAASWVLIWLFDSDSYRKGNLSVLGLRPTKSRLQYAGILFLVTALCSSTGFFMRMYFADEKFGLNPEVNTAFILTGIWAVLVSVLFEELLCRGVGLYILIKKVGQKKAILISATVFGLLHWLNNGVMGDPLQMALVFAYAFTFGLVLAYAYAKSFSLYLPIAMHFGWNLTQNFIFPEQPSGNTLLVSVFQPEVTVSYFIFFMMLIFPKVSSMAIDYLIVRKSSRQLK